MSDEARPTIEEALRRLEQTKAAFSLVGGNQHVSVRAGDLRTLLESHASMTATIKEAVRLMKPVADVVEDYDEAGFALDDTPNHRVLGRIARKGEEMAPCVTWADLRALAAFVSNNGAE